MQALIIGYGRAGRRHGAALDRLGVEWEIVDPFFSGSGIFWPGLYQPLEYPHGSYNFAVIATPPDLHLSQIQKCLDAGLPVLCEKPLCDLGQLEEAQALLDHPLANKVMLAFNYHFHPVLVALKRRQEQWQDKAGNWACFSDQHRIQVPEWGLLLDHLPHSIDILLWLSGAQTLEVERAAYNENDHIQGWFVAGKLGQDEFSIWDTVRSTPMNKQAWIGGPFGNVEVATSQLIIEQMTTDMLKVFLAHLQEGQPFPMGFVDGLRVQQVLEQISKRASWHDALRPDPGYL